MTSAARHAHSVEATLNYLAPMAERPAYYLYEPPPGTPWRNTKGDRHQLAIRDARHLAPAPSLDVEGFALVPFTTAVDDFSDAQAVRTRYYRDVERLVAHVTGAARVVAFDHNLRSATVAGRQAWTPLRRPVEGAPLAVCDARTIAPGDLVETDLRYRDRTGEVYSLRFSPAHRWFYFSRMRPDETMLLKCFDSDGGRARFTAHTAFDDPTASPDAPPRESIEVRTLAFFTS